MQNKLIQISFILIFCLTVPVKGQKQINTPYSRFNLGSLDPSGSFRSLSMGGTGVGMRDNNSVYFTNPASYCSFDTIGFLFDFGFDYSLINLNDGTNNHSSRDMNFDHLLMGFSIAKGWGVAAGLVPVSNGYYSLSETSTDPVIGDIISTHKGTGGLTSFFIGTGLNISRNLSAGVNMTVLFGELNRTNQFEFSSDQANTFNLYNSEKLKINGINLDYGLQYSISIKKNYFLTAGISYTAARKYRSDYSKISERYAVYQTSAYSPDTLIYTDVISRDSTKLPGTIKFGISFGKKDKYVIGIDYINSNWASARIPGSNGNLASTKSWLFGAELSPDKLSNTSYLARMDYRIGGHLSDNYLLINGERIKEYGLTFGLGFRLQNYFSKVNLYFDYTKKKGNLAKGLQNENFYTVGISLNLFDDLWFRKKKFE